MRHPAVFAATSLLLGIAYGIVTPPFEVPDEVGHYWRASSIAYGYVNTPQPQMPAGFGVIVYALWMPDRTEHITAERLRRARGVMLQPEMRGPIRGYTFYSPAAYVPQVAAAFIARVLRLRPFYGFYLGRFAALIATILLITLAGEIAPALRDHFHAVAMLPMSLFLFASWSADSMTIAAAFLTTALIIAKRWKATIAAALWLALCKPSYGLIAFLSRRTLIILAVIIGSCLSAWMTMSAAVSSPRPDLPVDSHAQVQFIRDDPVRFARVLASDLSLHAIDYLKMMVGRLGLADVSPPMALSVVLLILLAAVGMFNGPALSWRMRIAIGAISAAIVVAILTYLYITSSIAGGTTIEGTHGRYLLPIVPLILCLFRIPRLRFSVPYAAIIGSTALANLVCLGVLVQRYW